MEKILLLLHTDEHGALPKAAFEAVETARRLACGLKESGGLSNQKAWPMIPPPSFIAAFPRTWRKH